MSIHAARNPPPAKGSPRFDLPPDAIVDELLEPVVSDLPFASGDRVAVMVNGLGGTPISELYLVYGRVHRRLVDQV